MAKRIARLTVWPMGLQEHLDFQESVRCSKESWDSSGELLRDSFRAAGPQRFLL